MFVLQRTDGHGGYVARAGHKFSYVTAIHNARIFKTAEEARANSCIENESVVSLYSARGY